MDRHGSIGEEHGSGLGLGPLHCVCDLMLYFHERCLSRNGMKENGIRQTYG